MRDIVAWIVTVELLGAAVLPLLRAFFDNRRDAALLSRPMGLAIVAGVAWAFTLLGLPFERFLLLICLVLVAAASFLVARAARERFPGPFWGAEERLATLLFWACAAVFLAVRAAWPEILGQEKFMDLAFLSSLTRNTNMPPVDPWMAGLTINYYYWGYLLIAAATKLAAIFALLPGRVPGISVLVSYNLALATLAGYSFVAAACLGMRLSRGRLGAALAAAGATVFAGNVAGALDGWGFFLGRGFDYFHASRVIGAGDTINEFPFFTFFQADLHPHLLGFPYFIAAFAVGHRFLVREPGSGRGLWREWSPALLFAFTAGTAIAANLWTIPAVGILMVVVCALRPARGREIPRPGQAALGAAGGALLLYASYAMWWFYESSFSLTRKNPSEHGPAWNTMTSGLIEFAGVWGLFLAVGLVAAWPRAVGDDETARRRTDLFFALVALCSVAAGLLTHAPALIVVLPLLALAALAAWRGLTRTHDPEETFTAFLLLLGLSILAGCEFIHFKDSYGDRLQRMNTLFKFYHQAWPLLAAAIAVFAHKAWTAARGRRRAALGSLLAACALAGVLYPAAAILQRLGQREGPWTLDARPALTRRNAGDAAVIAWLDRNSSGPTVVMEATGDPYSEYARIASHTGVPTVLGWANHEGLWRENDPRIGERANAVRAFYTTRDADNAYRILESYHVTYVVLGDMERRSYPGAAAVAGLPFLDPVFSSGSTVLFRVAAAAPAPAAPAAATAPKP